MSPGFTYAVTWIDGDALFVGHAQLRARELRLEGRSNGREGLRTVPYGDVVGIDVQRGSTGRGLAVALAGGGVLTISSLDRPGSLGELADRLRKLTDSPYR